MKTDQVKVMTGNEACIEAAIAAGLKFFAGYPITPATEIAEGAAELLPKVGGKFIQMEDELASMGAVIGASMGGAKAMTATSGPGFSLMQENLGFAIMAEVPCVLVDVMRVGPCQGIATHPAQGDIMQAKWGSHGDFPSIALAPSTVREAYDLTIRAFNLAEKYRTPVVILSDAFLAHMSEKIQIPGKNEYEIINRKKPTVPKDQYQPYADDGTGISPMATFGDGYIWYASGIVHDQTGFPITSVPSVATAQVDRLFNKINKNLQDIIQYEEYMLDDAETVIVAYGSVARAAIAAVKKARAQGIKAGMIRPVTIWPFPEEVFNKVKNRVKRFIVSEMNAGQLYYKIREVVGEGCKVSLVAQYNGKLIHPETIYSSIMEEK